MFPLIYRNHAQKCFMVKKLEAVLLVALCYDMIGSGTWEHLPKIELKEYVI